MSSFNSFRNNILRDVFLIPLLDWYLHNAITKSTINNNYMCHIYHIISFTGIYAGFAIFSVLGYMFQTKCASTFQEVVAAGAELAFIVYPVSAFSLSAHHLGQLTSKASGLIFL
jgi:hypothetical protein